MSLEAVKQVAEAERISKERRVQAALDAKKLVADAEKAGQQAVAESKNLAEAQAKTMLARQNRMQPATRPESKNRPTLTALHCGPRRKDGWRKQRH